MSTALLQQIPRSWVAGKAARRAPRGQNPAVLYSFAPKPRADYSDLLGMSDLSDQPAPNVESSDLLLSRLVQEHLGKASTVTAAEKVSDTFSAEILHEPAPDLIIPSEPFQATQAPAAEIIPSAPFQETQASAAEVISSEPFQAAETPAAVVMASEPFKATEPAAAEVMASTPFEPTAPDHGGASVSAAELDALLSQDAKALVEQEQETAAASSAPAPVDDASAQINQADGVLAAELNQLIENPAATSAAPTVPAQTPVQTVHKPAVASSAGVAAPTAVKAKRSWFTALPHDLLLMLAQAMDLPFMKLSEEAKKLIAFAGLVLLASGSVLLIVGCLHR